MGSTHWSAAAAAALICLLLTACASAPKIAPPPPPPAPAAPALDASYDWHGLVALPFGSTLKEVPFTLHEVLMFRDAAHAAPADDAECYGLEQTAPRFLARNPTQYMLCFRHDHLARVEATVSLPQDDATRIFGDACELWRKNGDAGVTPAAQMPSEPPASGVCDGRDGAIAYSSRLEELAGQTDRALTMRLEALTQP